MLNLRRALPGLLVAFALPVSADVIEFDLLGVASGDNRAHVSFGYSYSAVTELGKITLSVTNTSVNQPDPRITGFFFNAPKQVEDIDSFLGPSGWDLEFDPNDLNAPGNFGLFDIEGSSGPNSGIGISSLLGGPTRTFQIFVEGDNLGSLTAASFLNLLSYPENRNTARQYFEVRFQRTGLNGQGSDVAIPVAVPEPATITMLGGGLAIVALARMRKRRAA
jgi:PEP-CTERM motif